MTMVAATPLTSFPELFALLPLGIVAGISGAERETGFRRRPRRARRR